MEGKKKKERSSVAVSSGSVNETFSSGLLFTFVTAVAGGPLIGSSEQSLTANRTSEPSICLCNQKLDKKKTHKKSLLCTSSPLFSSFSSYVCWHAASGAVENESNTRKCLLRDFWRPAFITVITTTAESCWRAEGPLLPRPKQIWEGRTRCNCSQQVRGDNHGTQSVVSDRSHVTEQALH